MRVLYAVHDHLNTDANLLEGLVATGADVDRWDPAVPFHIALSPAWTETHRAEFSERLLGDIRKRHTREPIDLMFGYFIDPLVDPDAIREIGRLGIVTVNYAVNSVHQFYLVDEIAPAFTFCADAERAVLPCYSALGARAVHMQMGANPRIYRPHPASQEFDVTFVGQKYADRPAYIAYLLRHGIEVRVWGPGWTPDRTYGEKLTSAPLSYFIRHPRAGALIALHRARSSLRHALEVPPWEMAQIRRVAGPSLPLEELVRMYSRSRISLGFSAVGDQAYGRRERARQIRMREFEAPMSGACYFVEHMDELSEYYVLGSEIVTYRSREDLGDQIRFHLARPQLIERIREAGRARAVRDHTWERRFRDLFRAIVPELARGLR